MTHPLDINRARAGGARRPPHDRNEWTAMGWALGVLGVFLTPVPLVGVASWVLSPAGVAVSLVAVAVAVRNRGGRTAAVGAALLCSVGVVFGALFADAGHLPAPPSSSAGTPERPALFVPAPGTMLPATESGGAKIERGQDNVERGAYALWEDIDSASIERS